MNTKSVDGELQILIEDALQQLTKQEDETLVPMLRPIIMTNLEKNRVRYWLGNNENRSPQDYVYLVAENYARYKDYLYQLQNEKSDIVWQDLFTVLQKWAYHYLLRKNFYPNQSTVSLASVCATEAAIVLLTARFPYDGDFMPWAHVVLLNICRRQLRQRQKSGFVPDENQIVLEDELAVQAHSPTDELRLALLEAIETLPQESWRQVLLLRYFDNLTPSEIALEMGKTASAIYNLHFKAMAALRKIWE